MSSHPENRLKDSASPYLRSAAHQPIDWHEWGDAAFARAQSEDKPILLDIGAVWCHWCHVIDRESYENPEIAKIINEHFVAVKVDRDERPDVDSRYQSAVSAISGQGGWPLTGFLLSDGKPFFGGTYFPPEDQMGRPGFRRILLAVADSYRNKRAELERAANSLADAVSQAEVFTGARADFDPGVVDAQIKSITQLFDIKNGGFGRAPKFPHSSAIDLILERYQQTKEKHLLAMAETTLEKMTSGGVYDQLAGGFHRYSVDERWLVPHFEKMSYDNSELLKNYLHGYQLTENAFLRETAEGIIGWVNEVLSDQIKGGFYASQDADYSLDDDGDYFTWSLDELRAALLPDEARVMELYYDVEAHGEMHHNPAKNVLWIARDATDIAKQLGLDETTVRLTVAKSKGKLLAARLPRPTPFIDKTMYVSWNAMFVSAYLDAAHVLGGSLDRSCRAFALKTLDRMLKEAWSDSLGFGHRIGGPALEGSLDDQVFSVLALLDAYEATLAPRYFSVAQKTMDLAIARYGDPEGGGFFDRPSDAAPLGGLDVRRKPFQDSPTPGANSVAAIALVRMHAFTGDDRYRAFAQKTLEAFAGIASQYGLFAATYGLAATLFAHHPLQVVITGPVNDPAAQALETAAHRVYRFGKSFLRVTPETPQLHLAGALKETLPHLPAKKALAVVCSGQTCWPPTSDPAQLVSLLENGVAGAATS
ncbi:MAG: thioredoxin domain-containing protein [Acidobacteria bacterium]|nr:MAG: thioredoxin domain-containing protein [Acidobacteriota bacterium]PYT57303.1 MAG: thioredoxin domain-containing protein [Acidobacteriota bacterium]